MPLQELKTRLSEDASTIVSPVLFSKNAQSNEWKEGVDQAKEEATAIFGSDPFAVDIDSRSDLNARVTGPVGIQIDATGVFGQADKTLLFSTVLLVLVLLLLIYRSPILAITPLVAVGIAYFVISPILGWISVIGEQFSPGQLAPVKVIVETEGKDRNIAQTLASLPYVAQVSKPQAGQTNPGLLAYDVSLNLNPYSMDAMNFIPELRSSIEGVLRQSGDTDAAKHVWISGETADQYDTKETNIRDMTIILPLIIIMIATLSYIYVI